MCTLKMFAEYFIKWMFAFWCEWLFDETQNDYVVQCTWFRWANTNASQVTAMQMQQFKCKNKHSDRFIWWANKRSDEKTRIRCEICTVNVL